MAASFQLDPKLWKRKIIGTREKEKERKVSSQYF